MQTVKNSSIQTSVYRDLPLAPLQESPFNPRKRFQQPAWKSLPNSSTSVEPLEAAAKRYRINTDKIVESVAAETLAKQKKCEQRRTPPREALRSRNKEPQSGKHNRVSERSVRC